MPRFLVWMVITSWIFITVLCSIFIINANTLFLDTDINLAHIQLILIVHTLISFAAIIHFTRWKLHVRDDQFHFVPGIGASKDFRLEDIKNVERQQLNTGNTSIALHLDSKLMVSVTPKYPAYDLLYEYLVREGFIGEE
jgi:hypothetical protein